MDAQFIKQRLAMNTNILNLYEQNSILSRGMPLITSSFLVHQEALFRAKAVQLLQVRSKHLVNTRQYSHFEQTLSSFPNQVSFDSMIKAFNISFPRQQAVKYEADETETSCTSTSEVFDTKPLEKFEELERNQSFVIQPNHSQREFSGLIDVKVEVDTTSDVAKPIQPISSQESHDESSYSSSITDLKTDLQAVSNYILANIGRGNENFIINGRKMFSHNPIVLEAYNALVKKYYSLKKVKEDIVRYILRKALKTIKKPVIEKENVQGKKALVLLCNRYFFDEFNQREVDTDQEEELVQVLLSYNQKSKNSIMNTNLVQRIFSSDEFLKDYQEFLPNLEVMLKEDNDKKFDKLVKALLECAKIKNFSKIASLKVFPWLDTWMEETIEIASQLANSGKTVCGEKKLKH